MAEAWPSLTTATTVLVVPKSMPMTGAIALLLGSLERSGPLLELHHHAVVPTLDYRTKGPHPAVVRTREAPDDVLTQLGAAERLATAQLGGCSQGLRVRLPLDARSAVGQAQRQEGHQVEEGHQPATIAPTLAQGHALVA